MVATYSTYMQISLQNFRGFGIDPVNSKWSVAPPGYSKLNVDGVFRDGQSALGGVLCDDKGNWI